MEVWRSQLVPGEARDAISVFSRVQELSHTRHLKYVMDQFQHTAEWGMEMYLTVHTKQTSASNNLN
jgi:hypothetical protein